LAAGPLIVGCEMTVNPASAQITLTLEASSEPIAGSYRTGSGQSGRFRGLLELVGALERARLEGVNPRAAGTTRSVPDVPDPTEA
jgi:hypothetical protein